MTGLFSAWVSIAKAAYLFIWSSSDSSKLASKGIGKSSGEGSGKGKTTYTPPASRTAPAQRTTVDDYDDFDDFGDDFGGR